MDIEELIHSVDIVEYISQYVDLELRGDEWWGISPFTYPPERTPSFSVRPDPPLFYDYSSGKGGNIYSFIKEYKKCTPQEVVDELKRFAGYDGEISIPHEKMAATIACKQFQTKKQQTKASTATKLSEKVFAKYEKNINILLAWINEGISTESLDKFNVMYDAFTNRIVYPIRNVDGEIVNIGGRAVDPDWKERGERKYTYFYKWGTIDTIYGLSENMQDILYKKEVIIFEGCKSVLLADTWGIHNTAAILTSHLSSNQFKILIKLGCDVVFGLDKDVDITKDKNIKKLTQYVNVYYLRDKDGLLDSKDAPVDKGKDVFKKLYDNKRKLQ